MVATDKRASLQPERLHKILFLRENLVTRVCQGVIVVVLCATLLKLGIFNRPGVAVTVLQTSLLLTD